ncbi:AzlD domain-containing protein [Pediococcus ethanolidurans]|uniref:Branched-chain amino acid transport protein n=1 Tax=Pediococcus ethanolidurans TaxID=319653 RepID=A0A0R2JX20_9LACO|nr:AzlD domain-containing protein [Pediococcus ethanolidurans]KRN81713.1 hypothetical protein IV87_GL001006 [Pediococcus ethanolidurans]MBU7554118.1 AzlD domain-containing protein [Pediococcus ethanolidurans]MBU7562876.1 AzlD domain-containing protein [Pediococcus ethanolidurans]MCT4398793.1 AzlD domain-containing protein [Pediococcus ethanolidurans]MCV3314605.1 AzlD domain-containing protein [Pediococcus ethanolidurans]
MHYSVTDHLLIVILGFFVAFGPRYIPILFFSNRKIPEWFNDWMKYVPVSLFTAIVVKDIFISGTYHFISSGNFDLILASVIVIIISYWTRSMAISVVFGLVAVMLLSMVI